jgi:hypothetical protein
LEPELVRPPAGRSVDPDLELEEPRRSPETRERLLPVEKALPVKRHTAALVLGAAALLTASVTLTAAAAQTPAATSAAAPAAAAPTATTTAAPAVDMVHAKATFEQVCSACHESALATDMKNTRKGWEQVVDRMFGFGLAATDEQVNEIVEYLSANYAP